MRLIDTSTRAIQDYPGRRPPYAILSHTWGTEEVTFEEFMDGRSQHKSGFKKIERFCQKAAADGWRYAWIDTCCINKTSSVEISEAINSMFKWYEDAGTCIVYLDDVPHSTTHTDWLPYFSKSHWFTRGWTLQELLAPTDVNFVDRQWQELGTKQSLKKMIESITGILDLHQFRAASIAQVFSWASRRQTTREEDRAYSLLGLVGVNMPLLYGEGKKAFERLQIEFLSHSHDDSIFAWECVTSSRQLQPDLADHVLDIGDQVSGISSLLAASLDQFQCAQNIKRLNSSLCSLPLWSMTNCGVNTTLHGYIEHATEWQYMVITVPLNCSRNRRERLTITLRSQARVKDLSSAFEKEIECTRTNSVLGAIPQEYCTREMLRLIRLLVTSLPPASGTQPMGSTRSLKISSGGGGSVTAFGFAPTYCMWPGSGVPNRFPRVAVVVNERVYEVPMLIKPSNITEKSNITEWNHNDRASIPGSRASEEGIVKSLRLESLDTITPLKPDCLCTANPDPRLWISSEMFNAKRETTILTPGSSGTTVYGFHSEHGDYFALIIHQSFSGCYVDVAHSMPSLSILKSYLQDDSWALSKETRRNAFELAYRDLEKAKRSTTRISVKVGPCVWISAAVKRRCDDFDWNYSVSLEASNQGPRWYVEDVSNMELL